MGILLSHRAAVDERDVRRGTALYLASQNGHEEVVKLLLAAGANPNVQVDGGVTALMVASQNGYEGVVEDLLASRADVSLRTDRSTSALQFAMNKGNAQIAAILRNAGAQ